MTKLAAALCLILAACGGAPTPTGPDAAAILADKPAATLAEYNLFADAAAREPVPGVLPYDLINPLFSDHAAKHRLVHVPDGTKASYAEPGVLDFPVGSVLIKTFAYAPDMREPAKDERYLETRLLIRRADGWVAYPYVWNEAQTEARYAPIGARIDIASTSPAGEPLTFTYAVPNRNQCKTCHQKDGDLLPIGPKARNLNHVGPHGVNQIADWTARGLLAGAPDAPPAAPSVADAALPVDARARAYLDINCAHCHRAGGSASNSGYWVDWYETSPARLGISKYPTAAGRGGGDDIHVVSPGAPDASILAYRMASTEPGVAMPELGRVLAHDEGVELIRAWIAEMERPAP